jgi:hypothetical protein
LEGFKYTTSLDLNMGYYHIELSLDSKKLCTLVMPFGKYKMQQLPMELCNSPDIFQEKVSTLMMEGLELVHVYINDLLMLSKGSFEDYFLKLKLVLQCLQKAGLKVNAKKSFFAQPKLSTLVVSNPLARRLKQFKTLWNQRHTSNFVALLVLLITTTMCGLEDLMYLHLF